MPNMGPIDSTRNPVVGHFSTSMMKLATEHKSASDSVASTGNGTQSTGQSLSVPISTDTVNFSAQAKQLSATFSGPSLLSAKGITKEEEEKGEKKEDTVAEKAKERIEEIKQEIEQIRNSSLSDEEKQQKIAALMQELATQTAALAQDESQLDVLDEVKHLAALER